MFCNDMFVMTDVLNSVSRLKSEKVKSPKKLDLKKESSFKKLEKKTDRIRTRHSSLESEGDISKLSQGK